MSTPEALFAAALGLHKPWSVERIEFDEQAGSIRFMVAFERGSRFACGACGTEAQPVHDTREREWRHLNFFQYQAFIVARLPRVQCSGCGKTTQVEAPWSRPGSGFTLMFEALVLTLQREMPVNAVANTMHVGDDPLWRILHHHVDTARASEDYSTVRRIGVDETAARRRHDYITLVHDLDAERVVFACEGRDSKTMKAFAQDLQTHGGDPAAIGEVCIDMSKAFISGVAKHLPQAKVTHDPYHVVALAGAAVDSVRRSEVKGEASLRG